MENGMTDKKKDAEPPASDAPASTEPDEECDDTVTISPPKEKVGEGKGNLERREEWFRKRSGA
jgi:hypothetical protein